MKISEWTGADPIDSTDTRRQRIVTSADLPLPLPSTITHCCKIYIEIKVQRTVFPNLSLFGHSEGVFFLNLINRSVELLNENNCSQWDVKTERNNNAINHNSCRHVNSPKDIQGWGRVGCHLRLWGLITLGVGRRPKKMGLICHFYNFPHLQIQNLIRTGMGKFKFCRVSLKCWWHLRRTSKATLS